MTRTFMKRIWILALVSALFAGCTGRDVATMMAAADAAFAERRYATASIEYRNVLDADENNSRARINLGRAYYAMAEYDRAIAEFDKVVPADRVTEGELFLLKANTFLRAELPDEAVKWAVEAVIANAALSEEADLIEGEANVLLGNWDAANATFHDVDPGNPKLYRRSLVGRAKVARNFGDYGQVEALLTSALELDPSDLEALARRAELRREVNDLEGARADLDLMISESRWRGNKRQLAHALRSLFGIQITARDVGGADETLAMIRESFSGSALEFSTAAVLLQARDDSDGALIAAQRALSIEPDSAELLLLNATITAAGGQVQQAERLARRVVAIDPGNETAVRLLASIFLRDGRYEEAENVLRSLDSNSETDLQLVVAQGLGYLRRGEFDQSALYFERGLALAPDNQLIRAGLARSYFASGDHSKAAVHLAAVLGEPDDADSLADIVELLAQLEAGNAESALARAREATASRPDDARAWLALGLVYQSVDRLVDAESAVSKALAVSPDYIPALRYRAEIRDVLGNTDGAVRDLVAISLKRPGDLAAVKRHAQLLERSGDLAAAINLLDGFRRDFEPDLEILFRLSAFHLRANNLTAAEAIAEEMAEIAPDDPKTTLTEVRIAYASGRKQIALQSLMGLAQRAPGDQEVLMALARLQTELGNTADARATLADVISLSPGNTQAADLWCEATVRLGQVDEGQACAEKISIERPEYSLGHALLGRVLLQRGRAADAAKVLSRAYSLSGSRIDLISLVRANLLAGTGRSSQLLEQRLATSPDDVGLRLLLAEVFMTKDDNASAIREYSAVLDAEPSNVLAANNLAWLLQASDPERAEQVALLALKSAPENPDVLDTAGWILLNNGKSEAAMKYLRQAADLGSNNPEVLYHLAVATKMSGSPENAVGLLREALNQNRPFASREDAVSLLGALEDDLEVRVPDE